MYTYCPSPLTVYRSFAAATILKATYGYSLKTTEVDPLVKEVEGLLMVFVSSIRPAAWLVDAVPVCESSLKHFIHKAA